MPYNAKNPKKSNCLGLLSHRTEFVRYNENTTPSSLSIFCK